MWEKQPFHKWGWNDWINTLEKMNLDPFLITYNKVIRKCKPKY